jgi:hypothetical protein
MNLAERSILTLFEELGQVIEKHGFNYALRALQNYRDPFPDHIGAKAAKVIQHVCNVYNITPETLLYSKAKKVERRAALEIAAFIMHRHYNIAIKEIALIVNKHTSNVHRYVTAADQYKETHPEDKKKILKLREIQHLIKLQDSAK